MTQNTIQSNRLGKKEAINFTLFSLGTLVSVFGSAIYAFAIGLHVLKTTGSGLSFATTLIFAILPVVIFGPFSGVIADRLNKKRTIILMDSLNAALFGILFVVTVFYEITLPIIYLSTFVSTTLTTIFSTCFEAAKPRLVSDDKLIKINSAGRIIDSSASIMAPLLGGVVFALIDLKLFMAFNAVSFLLSACMEYFIDFDFNSKVEALKENIKISFKNDIIEGFNFIGKRADIKKILGVLIAVNFFMSLGATVPLPYIINNVFMLSPKYYGIINGMFPLGIIVGALFVRRIIEKYSHDAIMTFTGIMLSLCTISLGIPLVLRSLFPHNALVIYYILVMFIFGMTIAFVDIPIIFRLQKTVDEKYRGRVLSIGISVAKIVQPLAYILSGLLLDVLQPSILVFSGGLMMLASTLAILKFGAKQDAQ